MFPIIREGQWRKKYDSLRASICLYCQKRRLLTLAALSNTEHARTASALVRSVVQRVLARQTPEAQEGCEVSFMNC